MSIIYITVGRKIRKVHTHVPVRVSLVLSPEDTEQQTEEYYNTRKASRSNHYTYTCYAVMITSVMITSVMVTSVMVLSVMITSVMARDNTGQDSVCNTHSFSSAGPLPWLRPQLAESCQRLLLRLIHLSGL